MRLRPLFILSDLYPGGAQKVILNIIRYIDRTLFETHLCIINSKGRLKKEIPGDIAIHDLKIKHIRYSLPGIFRLIRSIEPDMIISTLGHLNLLLLGAKQMHLFNPPIIVREANTPSIRLGDSMNPFLYSFFYRILYPRADVIICNSQYMKQDLMDSFGIREEKIRVIHNPVDAGKVNELVLREPDPYFKGKYHLVSVGRLNYQKGFDLLLKSFEMALKEVPMLYLTIIGDGPEEKKLKKIADELRISDSILFAGHKSNPYPYMAHADLCVSASRYEGSPNVVLESLACRTPVLAFDSPGGTGEIIKEGRNGWLVPYCDVNAMCKRIVEIVKGEKWFNIRKDEMLPDEHNIFRSIKSYEQLLIETAVKNDQYNPRYNRA